MVDSEGGYGGPGAYDGPSGRSGGARGLRREVRAVVFDLDGVLVDSFEVMRQAFSIAYDEVVGAGEAPFAEYNLHLGRYFPDIMRIMGLPPEMEAPFVRESYRLAPQVQVFPGIPELLGELHARGVPMAVATGKAGERARALLGRLGLVDLFEVVIGSDEVARPKPAPDMVSLAVSVLGAAAEETVMVGDAVTDMRSARGAGVAAAAALWAGVDAEPLLREGPDVVLRSPAGLLDLVAEPVPAP
ncbi:HAD-IA family hydrolase [Streptomyces griseorubiginosus]|uniref:HAD-IA family hydrolase n=1 Tax=Streptomyces griseorubiginosus TaxID=67304 RepID=UPI0033E8DA41